MNPTSPRRFLPLLVLAALCLVLGSTGGAVAGKLITGKQIKNNSVTSADIKNKSLQVKDLAPSTRTALKGDQGAPGEQGLPGAPGGVSDWSIVSNEAEVPASSGTSLEVLCPEGTSALGGSGYWWGADDAVQTVIYDDGAGVRVYTSGVPADDTLVAQAVCAAVIPAAGLRSSGSGKSAH